MSTVAEIQQAILNLPEAEYAEIIEWLYDLEGAEWDRQIEEDSAAGRLDFLKAEDLTAIEKGELRCLPTK